MDAEEVANSGSFEFMELAVLPVPVVFVADAIPEVVCCRTDPLERIFLTMDRLDRLAKFIIECGSSGSDCVV
jgi:hypothetical protein